MNGEEFEVIDRYFKSISAGADGVVVGSGDDCAVLEFPDGSESCVSTDTLIEGVHFPHDFPPRFIAARIVQVGVVIVATLFGIWICERVARQLEIKDPAIIVWDEFAGMWVAMLFLPSLYWLPVAFALFRLFDVLKPWPVSWADQKLDGGLGIMLDDVIAGILSLMVLQLTFFTYVSFS